MGIHISAAKENDDSCYFGGTHKNGKPMRNRKEPGPEPEILVGGKRFPTNGTGRNRTRNRRAAMRFGDPHWDYNILQWQGNGTGPQELPKRYFLEF